MKYEQESGIYFPMGDLEIFHYVSYKLFNAAIQEFIWRAEEYFEERSEPCCSTCRDNGTEHCRNLCPDICFYSDDSDNAIKYEKSLLDIIKVIISKHKNFLDVYPGNESFLRRFKIKEHGIKK